MARVGSFLAGRFTAKDGYIIEGISTEIGGRGFVNLIEDYRNNPDRLAYVGLAGPVTGEELYDFLSQLREQPINNGVKQIDVRGLQDFARLVDRGPEYHAWIIDDNRAANVGGTRLSDVILANSGGDRVRASGGDDFVSGGVGRDRIYGGSGDDRLMGERSDDILKGGSGNDILHGGGESDILSGNSGADTFYFDKSDFLGRGDVDVITDFGRGDQIVDVTGDLRVIASGTISLFGGRGTLLENDETGDTVFVKNAFLRQSDVKTKYTPPPPGAGDNVYNEPAPVVSGRVQTTVIFDDGKTKTEVVTVFLRNLTGETITNIEDFRVGLEGVDDLNLVPTGTFGASHMGTGDRFDLTAGGDRALAPNAEIQAFSFTVQNRPADVNFDQSDIRVYGSPRGENGPIDADVGFRLSLRVIEEDKNGASVEVFMRNNGTKQLVDLENMEFRFTETDVGKITAIWGADFFRNKFAVEPWAGAERAPLNPGETTKLFGFAFDYGKTDKNTVDIDDFTLASRFSDLLS